MPSTKYIQSPLLMPVPDRSALEVVTGALQRTGCSERGGMWSCPAHEDRTPSLSVTERNGKVLMNCFTGCATPDIMSAIGLTMTDLFDEQPQQKSTPVLVATYNYVDEDGEILFRKLRYSGPKTFKLQRASGSGWEWGLGNARRVLYNLPAIITAVKSGHPVIIAEGEKDCDRLSQLGLPATCNFDGAGKWKNEYVPFFKGASVSIIADNDIGGLDHAEKVRKSLDGVAASVRVLRTPLDVPKADVSDHLDAGLGLGELVEIPLDAPVNAQDDLGKYQPVDWHQVWEDEPEGVEWIMEPVIERGTANVIYSEAGIGKSLITQEMAAGIAKGGEVVMYIDSENRLRDYKERLGNMGYDPSTLRNLKLFSFPSLPPLDTHKGGDIMLRLAQRENAVLVIIDTTMRFVEGNENDADTFNAMYKHTMIPLKGAGIASLRLDHSGKDGSKGQRGSSGKSGDVDTVWRLSWPQRGSNRWLENEKDRTGHCVDKVRLEIFEEPHLCHAWSWDKGRDAKPTAFDHSAESRKLFCVTTLDELKIPRGWGRPKVSEHLKSIGHQGFNTQVLSWAIKERSLFREGPEQLRNSSEQLPEA